MRIIFLSRALTIRVFLVWGGSANALPHYEMKTLRIRGCEVEKLQLFQSLISLTLDFSNRFWFPLEVREYGLASNLERE